MRSPATASLVVFVAAAAVLAISPAEIRANPLPLEMVIDFDPPGYVHSVYPAPYTTVNAYVVADFSGWVDGVNTVAFRLGVTPMVAQGLGFQSSNPIVTITGDWETGVVVFTDDCMGDFPVTLGYLSLFYLGGSGHVRIEPHVDIGSVYIACDNPGEPLEFCMVQDGAIGLPAPEPRFICQTATDNVTWGAIKSLYR
jgi:hypothetical protein